MADAGTPQWQLTRTSRQGFWLGGLFTLVAVLSWLLGVPGGGSFEVFLAVLWTVFALALFASSAALRRREQQ